MPIRNLVTDGFGNGVYSPGVNRLPTDGFSIGELAAGEFSELAINSSLLDYFANAFVASDDVAYDEFYTFDPDDVTEWVELCVTNFRDTATRSAPGQKQYMRFSVEAHAWVKAGSNIWDGAEFASAVLQVLDRKEFTIIDHTVSSTATVGHGRLFEASAMDLTEETDDGGQTHTEHWLIRVDGVGIET